MSDQFPPSEFGGKTNPLGIQPAPHVPEAHEKLRAMYMTGDAEGAGDLPLDKEHEAFLGLLTEQDQRAIRESEGVFEKGQVWQEMTE